MARTIDAYLEVGKKRVFASAIDWPGWCRSGRDQEGALQALAGYGSRYKASLGRAATGFRSPGDLSAFRITKRLKGNATTDFGAPGIEPPSDRQPLGEAEAKRLTALLKACWRKFDRAADAASGVSLRKGPRGGGRNLDGIVGHVLDAERAYLSRVGGLDPKTGDDTAAQMAGVRKTYVDTVRIRARGDPPPRTPRSGKLWAPRYAVRRSAWHALDHAWEIEDRSS